jgi:hypothetical protein
LDLHRLSSSGWVNGFVYAVHNAITTKMDGVHI